MIVIMLITVIVAHVLFEQLLFIIMLIPVFIIKSPARAVWGIGRPPSVAMCHAYFQARCCFAVGHNYTQSHESFMYGFYYHLNDLRFKQSQNIKDCSDAHVVIVLFQVKFSI